MAKFKTRARTIDMLGRQQIAGIPTAISELFKNAHDAYADRVEVDYFLSDGLLILRDDGLGMTREDFEERWLTLGTDSKLQRSKGIAPPPRDPGKKLRQIMGEKGIGRLAIAAIGPQVMILTRAKREGVLHDLVVAFVHWGLFECPGVNLDQIEIPIRTFPDGALPDHEDVADMVNAVRENLHDLSEDTEEEFVQRITEDLEKFDLDLLHIARYLDSPYLNGDGHGTHFYILPASENLAADIEVDMKGDEVSSLRKLLLGFSNTMIPHDTTPQIQTSFRYWPTDEQYEDLIGEGEFFTPEEFEIADHHIKGYFDEFGQFKGTVNVYDEETVEHIVPWRKASGRRVSCGPFRINVSYLQGAARESKIPSEEYARITRKLDRISGLYIYRDGIRVLPYGDSKFDFLEIEERRTKSAGYYFFSYRRMFGAIEITRDNNGNLVEKAGREGFQENKAYREFKEILINFFVQIAADFFREGGDLADTYTQRKAELDRLERARRTREKQSLVKRRTFAEALERFFTQVEEGVPQKDVAALLGVLGKQMPIAAGQKDPDKGATILLEAEVSAKRQLADLRRNYRIQRPKGVGLTKQLNRDWSAYCVESDRLKEEIFSPAEKRIWEIIEQAVQEAKIALDQRRRSARLLSETSSGLKRLTRKETNETRHQMKRTQDRVYQLARDVIAEMNNTVNNVESEFNRLNFTQMDQAQIDNYQRQLESRLSEAEERYREVLAHVRGQLQNIDWSRDEEGHLIGEADMTAALEDELLALRERSELDLELSQLGMAIEIINHEFNSSIKTVRNNLRRLKDWADINPDLQQLYNNIRTSFDHLDGYLSLFTPLHRRLYRKAVQIAGADIATFLQDLFEERLCRHEVKFIDTPAFREKTVTGFPSTFYPVFVNLVDNAIFWLRDRPQPREIRLDADDESFIITDTGPGISVRDRDSVFELGFTRKPGGRGLGLTISRDVLNKEGFHLELCDPVEGQGATFKLYPKAL